MTGAKTLRELLAGLVSPAVLATAPDVQVIDITSDSRAVVAGAAFFALPGMRVHGVNHAAQALSAGAAVVLWEPTVDVATLTATDARIVAIPGLSAVMGQIADRFFDNPSAALTVAAVTGTNGKTTTAWLIAAALDALGSRAGYAGTLGYGRLGAIRAATHTTPDCITVHRQLAELRGDCNRFVGMEVSSHALDQERVNGVRFDTAVFTNLTRDHLDYHGTLQAYGAAKARLFEWGTLRTRVVNVDDEFGRELAACYAGDASLVVYSARPETVVADLSGHRYVIARSVRAGQHGIVLEVDSHCGKSELHSRLIGDFNAGNLLAVLATLLGWGIPLQQAMRALEQCNAPAGRMETLSAPRRPLVVVDYAHTPDALAKALRAARPHARGRLICVFGCGGDRDPGKRPIMGAIAEDLADEVIVTDDNPRSEPPDQIVAAILRGMSDARSAIVEHDRAVAIRRAIDAAGPDDLVLIAGKGHETTQTTGAQVRHFSDVETARQVLEGVP